MAYDEALADQLRDVLAEEPDLTEKKMFGGLAFLVNASMAVAVSGQGGIMVRVNKDQTEHLIATTKAEPMVMRDREMRGWVRLAAGDIRTTRQLQRWARLGVAAARAGG